MMGGWGSLKVNRPLGGLSREIFGAAERLAAETKPSTNAARTMDFFIRTGFMGEGNSMGCAWRKFGRRAEKSRARRLIEH